jgi:hypothetical protein
VGATNLTGNLALSAQDYCVEPDFVFSVLSVIFFILAAPFSTAKDAHEKGKKEIRADR